MSRTQSHLIALLLSCLLVGGCGPLNAVDLDRKALDSLRDAGSDLSKPHPFEFYLYHPDRSGAQLICSRLSAKGYRTTSREGAVEGEWLCLASTDLVPSFEALSEVQDLMTEIAERYGGKYDGWETAVVP